MSSSRKSRSSTRATAAVLPKIATKTNTVATASSVAHEEDCNCDCCCKPTMTVCLTFDMSPLQNLINMFPKINITSGNTCDDGDCEDDDDNDDSGQQMNP